MCGRYTLLALTKQIWEEEFDLHDVEPLEARYNIAPTQSAVVIRTDKEDHTRRLDNLRWGLIPHWANDARIGARMMNARSESAAGKPSFRGPLRRQRCLVPASGFYEWRTDGAPEGKGRRKQPYYIHRADGRPMAFAGLWDRWRGDSGETIESYTVLTTAPNELIRPLHDRMPVILRREQFGLWLDPTMQDATRLAPLMTPLPGNVLTVHAVGARVNNPRFDDASCIEAIA